MKVSIITVCYNSSATIEDTIKSVKSQTYKDIEYIIVDGGSTDSTNKIVSDYSECVDIHISEADEGLYDAMNKGLDLVTGDLIGILNSDDILAEPDTIQKIVDRSKDVDGVYADIGFYDQLITKKVRHYSSKRFHKGRFSRGFMPAHPSCYLKKDVIKRIGYYSLDYKIAADFDFLVRCFYLPNVSFTYLNEEVVKMRLGGVSTSGISANFLLNKEIIHSCKRNGIPCSWFSVLSKYPEKLLGFFFK